MAVKREQELLTKAEEYVAHMEKLKRLGAQRREIEDEERQGHNRRREMEAELYGYVGANIPTRHVVVDGKVVAITHGPENGRVRIYDCLVS